MQEIEVCSNLIRHILRGAGEDGNGGEKDEGKEVAHVKEEEREEKTAIARGSLDKGEDTMHHAPKWERHCVGVSAGPQSGQAGDAATPTMSISA